MRVHIDKAGRHNLTGGIIYFSAVCAQIFANLTNYAVLNENITDFITLCGGIDHTSALEEQCAH